MSLLFEHIIGPLLGGGLGTIGHLVTTIVNYRHGNATTAAAVQEASYQHQPGLYVHAGLSLVLVGAMIWSYASGQPDGLSKALASLAAISVAWLCGRVTGKD